MDRISAIRNVEAALREFEAGEADLAETERRVATVVRTYATEFDGTAGQAYRVSYGEGGDAAADATERTDERASERSTVVIADSAAEARERAAELADVAPGDVAVEPYRGE
jgi:hypothetical protein